jgi:Kelch motif
VFGADIFLIGGLSPAGVSTSTVFTLSRRGRASTSAQLPVPVHDAAATEISGHLLLFGGGPAEGSDRVVQVLPGSPRLIAKLPQSLSDLDAASIDGVAYVVGGFNGSFPIRDIYAAGTNGTVTRAGTLPLGVRYPAVAALGARVVVAGGETASGAPTSDVWSFDPATGSVQRLPHLPIPTDHAAGATLDGSFYLIAGLRRGVITNAILSWTPGESRWHDAGHLPAALSDLAAVPFDGGIAVIGGRGSAGSVSTVTVMRAR